MTVAYLDVDDEITNAVARLRGAPEPRIVLVVPPGSRISTSRMNFRLLAREARNLEKDLAIVSPESEVRSLAHSAGLATFASMRDYEAGRPDSPPSDPPTTAAPGTTRRGRDQSPAASDERNRAVTAEPAAPLGTGLQPRTAVGATGTAAIGVPEAPGVVRPRAALSLPRALRRTRVLVALAVLLLASTAGVAAYALVPGATITVTPRGEPLGPLSITATADPAVGRADPARAVIPAQRVQIPLSASASFPATGRRVELEKATGIIRFESENTLDDVRVPAGTRVSTASGIGFVTLADVVVPKADFGTGQRGREEARVEATNGGPEGNVPAGTLTRVPEELGRVLIFATNPAPMSGGDRSEKRYVQRSDYDAALAALTKRLDDQLAAALRDPAGTPTGLTLFAGTAQRARITADPPADQVVDQEAEEFMLSVGSSATVIGVDESQLAALAAARLRENVPDGYVLFEESVRTRVTGATVKGQTIQYAVSASAEEWRRLDAVALAEQVKGKSVAEARSILQNYGDVEIDTWPDFVDRLPSLAGRLSVIIRDPTRAGS